MTIFIQKSEGVIALLARAVSDNGTIEGDYYEEIRPGQSAFGRTYEEWAALDVASVEIS